MKYDLPERRLYCGYNLARSVPLLKKYTIETLHFSFAAVSLLMILILFCEEHSLARECCACPTFFSPVEQTVQSPSQIFLPNWHRNFHFNNDPIDWRAQLGDDFRTNRPKKKNAMESKRPSSSSSFILFGFNFTSTVALIVLLFFSH